MKRHLLLHLTLYIALSTYADVLQWTGRIGGVGDIPQGLKNVRALSGGSMVLLNDGTVVGWGGNTPPANLSNVTSIALGEEHGLALKSDGTVIGWPIGVDRLGQATVPNNLAGVVKIGAGVFHSIALKADGTIQVWGGSSWSKVKEIPEGLNNVRSIAAGDYSCFAIKGDGSIVGWGDFDVMVPPDLKGVSSISATTHYALAIKDDGQVICWNWGNNSYLTNLPPNLDGAIAVAAGDQHCMVLKSDGTVVSWGISWYEPPVVTGATLIAARGGGFSQAFGPNIASSPIIRAAPQEQNVAAGESALFNVAATGGAALLFYQWNFNGIPILGATNNFFRIIAANASHAGNYSVAVSNRLGSMLTASVKLRVGLANDNFTNATSIPPFGGQFRSSAALWNATKEDGEPLHGGGSGGKSVWFKWTADSDCIVTIDTIGSNFDSVLAVYTGDKVNALSAVAADDDGGGFIGSSLLTFAAKAGVEYKIAIDSFSQFPGCLILNLTSRAPLAMVKSLNPSEGVSLQILGVVGQNFRVETSHDLATWKSFYDGTIPASGTVFIKRDLIPAMTELFFRLQPQN